MAWRGGSVKRRALTALPEVPVQFPAPMSGCSYLPITPASGDIMYIHIYTYIHINKNNFCKVKKNIQA